MRSFFLVRGAVLAACCLCAASVLQGATLVVTSAGDSHVDGQLTLREAINNSFPGDIVSIDLPEKIQLSAREIIIDHDLTLKGPSGRTQVVKGTYDARIFRITAGVVEIANLTLTGAVQLGRDATRTTAAGTGEGGAIYNGGTLTLRECQFATNSAQGGEGDLASGGAAGSGAGGAVYNVGDLSAVDCFFDLNAASGGGGTASDGGDAAGGAIYNAGNAALINCTFQLNVANGSNSGFSAGDQGGTAKGGAVFNTGSLDVKSCTIWKNSAQGGSYQPGDAFGGGVLAAANSTGPTIVQNTIIADNHCGINTAVAGAIARGDDVFGGLISEGHNLIGNAAYSSGWKATDQLGSRMHPLDPMVQHFAFDNGGPTKTLSLKPGSPAIDQGSSDGVANDQRGLDRTFDRRDVRNPNGGDGTDIGAFELQPAAPAILQNVSARVHTTPGDGAAIAGLIITEGAARRVLFRGVGPQLFGEGLAEVMTNPTLEIHSSSGQVIARNDDWEESQRDEIEALDLYPLSPTESAILIRLQPGQYTAVLRGRGDETGIALLECYDLTDGESSQLANLSVRGHIGTSNDVVIDGFMIAGGGGGRSKIVVRVLGPSLATHQLDALNDPTLTLHDDYGSVIASNDNWRDRQQRELASIGLAPTDDRESAILANLPPGSYTAIARGKGETTGIGLVEVYSLR